MDDEKETPVLRTKPPSYTVRPSLYNNNESQKSNREEHSPLTLLSLIGRGETFSCQRLKWNSIKWETSETRVLTFIHTGKNSNDWVAGLSKKLARDELQGKLRCQTVGGNIENCFNFLAWIFSFLCEKLWLWLEDSSAWETQKVWWRI